jgi:hypothetical protein
MNLRLPLLAASVCLAAPLSAHEGDGVPAVKFSPVAAAAPEAQAVIADGELKFVTNPGWGVLPNSEAPGSTHGGVVRDKAGHVYVSTDGAKGILVFNADGSFKKSIATEFKAIHGMNIREEKGEEFIYAAWLGGGHALKLKLDGTAVLKLPCPMESGKYKDAGQYKVTAVDSAPDGSIFASDGYGQHWIHKYDATGKYLMSFGGKGTENGQFNTPHGIGVDLRGEKPLLLVADRANGRLQHHDLDGKYVATIATGLRAPCAVAFEGRMIVIPELQGRVTILNGDNKEVAHLGTNPVAGEAGNFGVAPDKWDPTYFTAPHGACWDGSGGIIVQDWNKTGRVRHLKPVK